MIRCGMLLPEIVAEIRKRHREHVEVIRKGLDEARELGNLLLQAKEIVGRGNWMAWVKENCPFALCTAHNYMRVARDWDVVEAARDQEQELPFNFQRAKESVGRQKRHEPKHRETAETAGWIKAATVGTVKDVASMCFDMVMASSDPPAVVATLTELLKLALKNERRERYA